MKITKFVISRIRSDTGHKQRYGRGFIYAVISKIMGAFVSQRSFLISKNNISFLKQKQLQMISEDENNLYWDFCLVLSE